MTSLHTGHFLRDIFIFKKVFFRIKSEVALLKDVVFSTIKVPPLRGSLYSSSISIFLSSHALPQCNCTTIILDGGGGTKHTESLLVQREMASSPFLRPQPPEGNVGTFIKYTRLM